MDENKVIKKLLEHDEEFEKIRSELKENQDEILTRLDGIMVIVQRIDQERIFTFEYVKRLQKDIDKVKKILKI